MQVTKYIVPVFWIILSDLKSTYEKEIDENCQIFSDIVLLVSSFFVTKFHDEIFLQVSTHLPRR